MVVPFRLCSTKLGGLTMNSEQKKMLITAADGYFAWLAATAEVGGRLLELGVADGEKLAKATATALKTPKTHRQSAMEEFMVCAHDAHMRQLHALRGASTVFGMSFLSHFEARHQRQKP